MKATILMTTVTVAALAAPAFAGPDRYDQGYSCTGIAAECVQQQMRLEDGNRFDEKPGGAAINGGEQDDSGTLSASRGVDEDDNDTFADDAGDVAEDAGEEISVTAEEAGEEIADVAEDVGEETSEAAEDVGDEVSAAFE